MQATGASHSLGQAPELGPIAGHISGLANGWPAQASALRAGEGDREWLLSTIAALKTGGGTALSIQAALGLGHRLPLDGVNRAALSVLPPSTFRRSAGSR